MRTINEIIVHCSATKEGQNFTTQDIDRWHKARGFKCIGYHYVIYIDGSVHFGRPIEEVGAHVKNHNAHSIGICYIGGLDKNGKAKDTRTPEQKLALYQLIYDLKQLYPNAKIATHNMYDNKACPCFSIETLQKEYQLWLKIKKVNTKCDLK